MGQLSRCVYGPLSFLLWYVLPQQQLRKGIYLISSYMAGSDLMQIMEFWRKLLIALEEGEISKSQRDFDSKLALKAF